MIKFHMRLKFTLINNIHRWFFCDIFSTFTTFFSLLIFFLLYIHTRNLNSTRWFFFSTIWQKIQQLTSIQPTMSADWISLNVILFSLHSLLLVAVYVVVHHTKFNFIFTFQCFYNNAVKWPFFKPKLPLRNSLFYFNWIYKQRNWWVGPPEELFSFLLILFYFFSRILWVC